jgi:hypothetical protein
MRATKYRQEGRYFGFLGVEDDLGILPAGLIDEISLLV